MTSFYNMSPSRRAWTVYRTVIFLKPKATVPAIRDAMAKQYSITLGDQWFVWIDDRLNSFQAKHFVRWRIILDDDGVIRKYWFPTGQHEKMQKARRLSPAPADHAEQPAP